jgi:high-affinity iron transporter
MFETALVCFREGLESFLIVAIIAGYLIKTDRRSLLPSVWLGLVAAIGISYMLADFIEHQGRTHLFEGLMAIVAALLVASLTYYVAKNARHFSAHIKSRIDTAHGKAGMWKFIAMFLFTVLMVTREGFEIALLLSVIAMKNPNSTNQMIAGGIIGVGLAGLLGFLWMRYSHLINIGKFMKVTAIFLFLFTLHLFIYGIHELAEGSLLPLVNNHEFAEWTEEIAEEGFIVWAITYGMILIPVWFMIQGFIRHRKLKPQ